MPYPNILKKKIVNLDNDAMEKKTLKSYQNICTVTSDESEREKLKQLTRKDAIEKKNQHKVKKPLKWKKINKIKFIWIFETSFLLFSFVSPLLLFAYWQGQQRLYVVCFQTEKKHTKEKLFFFCQKREAIKSGKK